MALISLRQLLDHAAENGYGLPAFNVPGPGSTRLTSVRTKETAVRSIAVTKGTVATMVRTGSVTSVKSSVTTKLTVATLTRPR